MWQLIEEFEELILRGMSTKDIEREHRLKAESDKNHQESNLKDAIDEAHASMKNAFAEAFREIELEVERYLIKRRNRRLQLEEANRKVNRIDLSLEDNDMKSYSGTQTKDYTNTEIVTVDISELSTIDEQSELEIVNDIEVDWDEDFVFDHSGIESKLIVTEEQPMEVERLFFHSKCYAEMTTQQEVNAMKDVTMYVEVFRSNVLNFEIELNSFAQFGETLPRQVWDPGLKCDKILL